MKKVMELLKREDGVTAPEYALIAALVAVVIIAGVTLLGTSIRDKFTQIGTTITNAGN
jgi:pilus assembly protein Flp/PilA